MSLLDDITDARRVSLDKRAKTARILTIDIETRPHVVYSWGMWRQNHHMDQIVQEGGILCFAAKWFGEPDVIFHAEPDGKDRMLRAAWDLLTSADVVVTYNGDKFDLPRLNQEFMLQGWGPPAPFKSIDLIKTNRRRFDLPSRKLDYLAQRSGVGAKVKHDGFQLWVDCMAGDAKAWAKMRKYNEGDVKITERTYLRLLPWLEGSAHMGLIINDESQGSRCPNCGSTKLRKHGKPVRAFVRSYSLYRCSNCQSWCRDQLHTQHPVLTRPIK